MERAQKRALFERNREENYARAFASEIEPLDVSTDSCLTELRRAVEKAPSADKDLASRRIPARWYASEKRLGRLQHAFGRLAELAAEHRFTVTVLIVPYLEDDPLIERGLELVRSMAEARGFQVVEASESFRDEGLAKLRMREEDPVHPNARGHTLLAQALAEALSPAERAD